MQIILMEKVANLGILGDIVRVKDGYARNYLIPQGKAKRATESNIAEFEQRRVELEKEQARILADAQTLASNLGGLLLQVTRKAGVDGRLFGSVTNIDISEALADQGFTSIIRSQIRLPNGPLKQIGDYTVDISLHTDVTATITVSVLGEHA